MDDYIKKYQCNLCKHSNNVCSTYSHQCCHRFVPASSTYSEETKALLEASCTVYEGADFIKRIVEDISEYGYICDTRDYHNIYIADVLENIRTGETDYVYNPAFLEEIYSFEKNIEVEWEDFYWKITKKKETAV